MDETYQDYINRVTRLTLPVACSSQLQTIQPSPKFAAEKATSFPGYSVITPPGSEDRPNQDFYTQLATLQNQLSQQLEPNLLVSLPSASFHITLADLIWDQSYRQAIAENANFDQQLREQIAESFQQYSQSAKTNNPLTWKLWGIVARPRAIMACLIPQDRESYEPIIQLRRSLYQNSGLIGLGIEQQYDLTAHITLGYFGNIPPNLNRDRLCIALSQINDRLIETEQPNFTIERAELRKFDSMVKYYREPDWAMVSFGK